MTITDRKAFDKRYPPNAFGSLGVTGEMFFEVYSLGSSDAFAASAKEHEILVATILETKNAEIARLQRVVAQAALCIMENPHDAICDTIWLSNSSFGGITLYENLVGSIEVEQTGDVDSDKELLKRYIEAAQQEG